MQTLTIRQSSPHDSETLTGLAELDSSRPLHEPALVAEVGDEIWAAVSLRDQFGALLTDASGEIVVQLSPEGGL